MGHNTYIPQYQNIYAYWTVGHIDLYMYAGLNTTERQDFFYKIKTIGDILILLLYINDAWSGQVLSTSDILVNLLC